MGLPIAATEQYPKGLGPTVPELELEKYGVKAHPKSCFTMFLPDLMAELKEKQPETKSIILCGVGGDGGAVASNLDKSTLVDELTNRL